LMFKKYLKFLWLVLALVLLLLLVMQRGMFLGFQRDLQNKFYDYDQASSEIVIVAIDEKSLKSDELGPLSKWPRENYARAIDILNKNKAAVIGVDITFPDESGQGAEDDKILAETLRKYDNVVLAVRYFFDNGARRFEWPNDSLLESDTRLGWINIQLDEDGFVRSIPLFAESNLGVIDAFSLALTRIYLRADPSDYRVTGGQFRYSDKLTIPSITKTDKVSGEDVYFMYINYFAEPNQFTRISFTDLLSGELTDKNGTPIDFRDKIVIIGPTAIDLQDDFLSPVSSGIRMPGAEIHANNVQTIITGQFLRDQSGASLWITLLGFIAINIIVFSFLKVRYALVITVLEVFGMLVAGIVSYEYRILVNVVYPILVILLSFVGAYLMRFIIEQKERKFIEGAFGHYVNKTVVEQIQKNPDLLKLGGSKRDLTIFFSDIQGFTSISEKLEAEELVTFLNEYLGAMTEIIISNEGTLDKYEGDAIMCFWNAPIEQHGHALKACITALENQTKLVELRKKWGKKGLPELRVRIGINTGVAVVGNIGSVNRFDYTAMGDNVNLASRLESINKQYGTFLMISEYTYEQVKEHVICRELDQIRVKGKEEPVRIYELIAKKGEPNAGIQEQLDTYARALTMYRAKNFMPAKVEFEKLTGDLASEMLAKRCDEMMKNPPDDNWDGVHNFDVK